MSKPTKLPSLDAGRFVAALMVSLFHNTRIIYDIMHVEPLNLMFRAGHSGVEFFFVLSGFIIFYVHERDLGHRKQVQPFITKRLLRIVPGLWLVAIPWGLISMTVGDRAALITSGSFLMDMFLVPHEGEKVLTLTWTLQRELVFYLLFAFTIFSRKLGLAMLVAWQAAIIALNIPGIHELPLLLEVVFGINNLGFGAGLLVAWMFTHTEFNPKSVLWLGIALFVGTMAYEWSLDASFDVSRHPLGRWGTVIWYTSAASFILYGLVRRDAHSESRNTELFSVLGGASYVLYLVHAPVGSVMIRLLNFLPFAVPAPIMLLMLVGSGLGVAVLLHLYLERPLMTRLRKMLLPEPARLLQTA